MASADVPLTHRNVEHEKSDVEKRIWRFLRYLFTKGGLEQNNLSVTDGAVDLSSILDIPQLKRAKVPITEEEFETVLVLNETNPSEIKEPFKCIEQESGLTIQYCPELDVRKDTSDNANTPTADASSSSPKKKNKKKNKKSKQTPPQSQTDHETQGSQERSSIPGLPAAAGQKSSHKSNQSGATVSSEDMDTRPTRSRGGRRPFDPDTKLSKALSFTLRHGAEKMGLPMHTGGFIYFEDLFQHERFRNYTREDVERVTVNNDKQRFFIDYSEGKPKIRANQGHTLQVEVEMTEITDPTSYPTVIHGTYAKAWEIIKSAGLSRMGRNHIHFARDEPGSSGVISGMRKTCEVIIAIDIEKALNAGIKFFESANGVILTTGNEEGMLKPCFFKEAYNRNPRRLLTW